MNRDEYESLIEKFEKQKEYAHLMDDQLALNLGGKFQEAYDLSERLLSEHPEDDRLAFNHGFHLVRRGRLAEGFKLLTRGRSCRAFGRPFGSQHAIPMNRILDLNTTSDIRGKRIFWRSEGGLGDEIIFIRFAKKIKDLGGKLTVSCSHALSGVFSGVEWIDSLVLPDTAGVMFDYWLPAMSSPYYLNVSNKELKKYAQFNISPDLSLSGIWKNIPKRNGTKSIGIRWAGNPEFEHEQHRTYPIWDLIRGINLNQYTLYSFQLDDSKSTLFNDARMDLLPNGSVVDLSPFIRSWGHTAVIASKMDRIISSCTSLPHLTGSMGIRTDVIVPCLPYYPWAGFTNKSDWYRDNVTLHRQSEFKNWEEPIKSILKTID